VTTRDNDRIAYLEGEPVEVLSTPDRAELDQLRALLQAPATWLAPDPSLEGRVVAAISQEARAVPRGHHARSPSFRSRPFLRRRVYGLGAVAVAAAAAIIVAVGVGTTSPAPLHFAMVVSGTSLAPDAHGSASLTKMSSGWRIELSVTGLPHLTGARYYQAWLKNPAAILVPVGTFDDARQVTLWAGVPVTEFRTLTVTRQRANGDPASSGERVLIGTIRPSR
jgi:hypothetical protein